MMTEEQYERIVAAGMIEVEKYSLPLIVFAAGAEQTGLCQFATGCLLAISHGVVLVTSGHVLQHFIEMDDDGRLQIGQDRFVVRRSDDRSISIGSKSDIGVLTLTEEERRRIGAPVLPRNQVITSDVRQFELVAFSGFPGALKHLTGPSELAGEIHQVIGPVEAVETDQFSMRTDADRYEFESLSSESDRKKHYPLGGISGAPVFSMITGSPYFKARRRAAVVGWVHEGMSWDSATSKVYAVKAAALSEVLPDDYPLPYSTDR